MSGLAFLLVGSGLHITQTAGLALAIDLASEASRPRVVAFLYVMLLLGMVLSALAFGTALADFSQLRLIQVIQSAAVVTLVLNVVALWKQEVRRPELTAPGRLPGVPSGKPGESLWPIAQLAGFCSRSAWDCGLQHAGHLA